MPAHWTLCVLMAAFGSLAVEANLADAEDPKKSETSEKISAETIPEPHKSQQTVDHALEFVAKEGVKWRNEHGCVSCHHGTMTAWALSEAKNQGYLVDAQTLEDAVWQTKVAIVPIFNRPPRSATVALQRGELPGTLPGSDVPKLADSFARRNPSTRGAYRAAPGGGWSLADAASFR